MVLFLLTPSSVLAVETKVEEESPEDRHPTSSLPIEPNTVNYHFSPEP